ncbi:hypothetical protein MTO96_038134, partial [Rhipicephalus appendiculatus]
AADEQTLLDGVQASGDGATCDAYQQALAVLDAYFAPPEDAVCVRARFRRRIQEPDETAVQFIEALHRLADNCNFGTAAATMLHGQILHGLRDPNLLRTFIQMGDAFTIQSALEHAREEERVDRALQQLNALQVDSATRREPGRRGGRPPRPTLQQRASIPTAPSAPPSVCYRCGSPQHWANFPSCPARCRTCSSCGKQGHFSEMCRSAGTSVAVSDGDAGQELPFYLLLRTLRLCFLRLLVLSGRLVLFYVRRSCIRRLCQPCSLCQFLLCVLPRCIRRSRLHRLCPLPFCARFLRRRRRAMPHLSVTIMCMFWPLQWQKCSGRSFLLKGGRVHGLILSRRQTALGVCF